MRSKDNTFYVRVGVGRAVKVLLPLAAVVFFLIVTGSGSLSAQEGSADLPYSNLDEAIDAAGQWLVDVHQNTDGGYSSFSAGADRAPSDVSGTADAILALAAAGHTVSEPLDYFRENGSELIDFAGQDGSTAAKIVLALQAASRDPRDFRGHDYVADINHHLTDDGHFGIESPFSQALAILALSETGESPPDAAISWLSDRQVAEGDFSGSWDDGFGTQGNPDATAMAVMALLAAGIPADDQIILKAEQFLERSQLADGSWEYGQGFGGNANSTALVLRSLIALGQDIEAEEGDFVESGTTPLGALWRWQAESGAFQADLGQGPVDDFFATVQALPALAAAAGTRPEMGSDLIGGDSPLPFWIVGFVAFLFLVLVGWYIWASRH